MKKSKTNSSLINPKIYGIKAGRKTGVLDLTPSELDSIVKGFKGACYRKFETKEEAELFVYGNREINSDSEEKTCSCCGLRITFNNKICFPNDAKLLKQIQEAPVIIYTDGSFFFQENKARSCGLGIFFVDNSLDNEGAPLSVVTKIGPRSSARAEIAAAIRALQIMSKYLLCPIILRSDCLILVSAMTDGLVQQWLNSGWKNFQGSQVENWDLFEALLLLIGKRKNAVRFEHVYGHREDQGNIMADWLAKQGAKVDVGFTYINH